MDSTNNDHLAFVTRLGFCIRRSVAWAALLLFVCSRVVAGDVDLATASSRLLLDTLMQYVEDPSAKLSLTQEPGEVLTRLELNPPGIALAAPVASTPPSLATTRGGHQASLWPQ